MKTPTKDQLIEAIVAYTNAEVDLARADNESSKHYVRVSITKWNSLNECIDQLYAYLDACKKK